MRVLKMRTRPDFCKWFQRNLKYLRAIDSGWWDDDMIGAEAIEVRLREVDEGRP